MLPEESLATTIASGWEERPVGRQRLQGMESDSEDNVLKELLIAGALLERTAAPDREQGREAKEKGILQVAYPILVGRQQPEGHPDYPRMGNFFHVQGGGGRYPPRPSPPTSRAVAGFLLDKARLAQEVVRSTQERSVELAVGGLTRLQGCQLWNHAEDLAEEPLTKEQEGLVGKGYAGPPVDLNRIALSLEQKAACGRGLDERQLRMLKAEVRAKKADFHEIIDRAVSSHEHCANHPASENDNNSRLPGEVGKLTVSLEKGMQQGGVGGPDLREAIEVSATGELVYCE